MLLPFWGARHYFYAGHHPAAENSTRFLAAIQSKLNWLAIISMTAFWQRRVLPPSGAHFLSPFDDADVIEGQASVAVEIERQLGGVPDHIVLPVGGGGLASGMLGYFPAISAAQLWLN